MTNKLTRQNYTLGLTEGWITESAYKNWISIFTLFGEFSLQEKGVSAGIYPHIPLTLFNNVLQTDLAIQDVNQTIKWIESKYHEHNLDFTWSITPFTNPNNFETYLKNYGFKEVGKRPHMGLLHSKFDKNQFEHELEETDLEIRKIKIENLDEYMNCLSIGFGFSENKQIKNGYHKLINDFLKMLPSNSPSGAFLGYVNDRPVCTSLGFISDNVMGIYYIATIPEFRKRGYGRLMTTDLIIRGANAKTKGSILQASEMGKTVYEKIGFETKYFQRLFKLENKIKRSWTN